MTPIKLTFISSLLFATIILTSCNNSNDKSSSKDNETTTEHQDKALQLSLDDWLAIQKLNSGEFLSKMKDLNFTYVSSLDTVHEPLSTKFHYENFTSSNSKSLFTISRSVSQYENVTVDLTFNSNADYYKQIQEEAKKGTQSCANLGQGDLGFLYNGHCVFFSNKLTDGKDSYSIKISGAD